MFWRLAVFDYMCVPFDFGFLTTCVWYLALRNKTKNRLQKAKKYCLGRSTFSMENLQ